MGIVSKSRCKTMVIMRSWGEGHVLDLGGLAIG